MIQKKIFRFLLVFFSFILISCSKEPFDNHNEIIGSPYHDIKGNDLKETIITPYSDIELSENKNVIFCADFQLAWNEICKMNMGPVYMDNATTFVEKLNNSSIHEGDIDDQIIFSIAGIADENTPEMIYENVQKHFGGKSSPDLIADNITIGSLYAYSYLFSNLPFRWEFERLQIPLNFRGDEVQSFGISQFDPNNRKHKKISSQVLIYNLEKENEFIVELITLNENNRLIIARMNNHDTLKSTISYVLDRVDKIIPVYLSNMGNIAIPIFNFKITKHYDELCFNPIQSSNDLINDQYFTYCLQQIRFRMDERGAIIKSESLIYRSKSRNFNFDDSFLLILIKKGSKNPYFAMWVSNPELMVPWEDAK